ncbi:hypothetical protein EMMF5_002740 [Cystobasidiomycetes sp. EMM_F5]
MPNDLTKSQKELYELSAKMQRLPFKHLEHGFDNDHDHHGPSIGHESPDSRQSHGEALRRSVLSDGISRISIDSTYPRVPSIPGIGVHGGDDTHSSRHPSILSDEELEAEILRLRRESNGSHSHVGSPVSRHASPFSQQAGSASPLQHSLPSHGSPSSRYQSLSHASSLEHMQSPMLGHSNFLSRSPLVPGFPAHNASPDIALEAQQRHLETLRQRREFLEAFLKEEK